MILSALPNFEALEINANLAVDVLVTHNLER